MIPKNVIKYHSLKHGISYEKCITLFNKLELFFQKTIIQNRVRPTKEVDEVWHTFILHTHLYEKYCRENFGSLIHHNPHMPNQKVNCDGTSKPKPDDDECDSAFIEKNFSRCDSGGDIGGNPGGPNDCDSQFYPKQKKVKIEYHK